MPKNSHKRELRVLFLTHVFSDIISGGETKAAWEFADALAKRGVKIFVVTTFAKFSQERPHQNIKIYRVPFSRQSRNFTRLDAFKTFLWALPVIFLKKIDIIHLVNTQEVHPFAYLKARPYVSTVDLQWKYEDEKFREELMYDRRLKKEEFGLIKDKSTLWDKILGKIANIFFKIFKIKEPLPKSVDLCAYRHAILLERLKKQGYQCKFVHFPVGVDTEKFSPLSKDDLGKNKDIIFLFVGSVAKRKGVGYLISAFNSLAKKYKNIQLSLVGPGAPETVIFFKETIEPGAKIKFLGELSTQQLIQQYRLADVFLAPSIAIDMGFNKSVVEAMACGKPVIINRAHDSEGLDGKIGFCVQGGDVEGLAKVMESFIENPALIKSFGKSAREFVLANHSWQMIAQKIEQAYRQIVEKY